MNKGGEVSMVQLDKGKKYKSGLQLIGKGKPSVLGLLSFLSAKSIADYLSVCVADPSLWVFSWFGVWRKAQLPACDMGRS